MTDPSLLYREVENVAPPKYESPKLRDLAEIEEYPEGFTNEYENYQVENYFGSDGSDHSHFRYDNIDWIDLNHNHSTPFPNERQHRILPESDHFFVTTVNNPAPVANYSSVPLKYQKNPGTYTHPELGVQVYLVDNTIVPGQNYTPHQERTSAKVDLDTLLNSETYDGPIFDNKPKRPSYKRGPKPFVTKEGVHSDAPPKQPYVSPYPNLIDWPTAPAQDAYEHVEYVEVVEEPHEYYEVVEEVVEEPVVEVVEEPVEEVVEEPEPEVQAPEKTYSK